MSWQKAIILNPNEQVLHSWDGDCERHHKTVEARMKIIGIGGIGHKTVDSKEIHSGTLVLTNQRLLWFERRGFLSKTQRASFEIDLRNLMGITSGGTIAKWVSITDRDDEFIFHLKGVGSKEIEPFRDMILRQVEKLKGNHSETLNINIKKEIINKTDIPPIWECPYCKGKNFQTLTECKHCGAPKKDVDEESFSTEDPHQIP
jgi:hypothetical protein